MLSRSVSPDEPATRNSVSMIMRWLVLVAAVVVLAVPASAESIYSLIAKGKLDAARDSLSKASTASLRDGNRLFYMSRLAPNGNEAARLMAAALRASVSPTYHEEIYFRLAQYHFLQGNLQRLHQLVTEYGTLWEAGRFRGEMLRLSAWLDEKAREYESAVRQSDRYLLEYSEGDARQWGLLDKARIMLSFGKKIGAVKLLRQLSREKSGPGVSQALFLLAQNAIDASRTDDAVFYFNVLREGYPAAVGLDILIDRMSGMTSPDADDAAAEKLTGTYYSVKVGVFAERRNAERQARKFSAYDKKVDVKTKTISDKKYRIVYVGRFQTYNEALAFKETLEANHKEVFQVVAR